MPAINFKAEYAAKILEGSKPFTLRKRRADYRDPAPLESELGLFTGMRTKSCRKFATARCAMRATVAFNHAGILLVEHVQRVGDAAGNAAQGSTLEEVMRTLIQAHGYPNGPGTPARLERIAQWDGFASWADMWAFHEAYGLNDEGVAVRELIGFAHVMPTTGGADDQAR